MILLKHLSFLLVFLFLLNYAYVASSVVPNVNVSAGGFKTLRNFFEGSDSFSANLQEEIYQELNHLSLRKQREIFEDLEKQEKELSKKTLALLEPEGLSPLNVEELKNVKKTIKTTNSTLPAIRNKRTLNFLLQAVARAMGYTLTPRNPDAEWIPRQRPQPPQQPSGAPPPPCPTTPPPCRPSSPSPPPCPMPPTTPPCSGSMALMQNPTIPPSQIDANTISYPYRPARTIPLLNFAPLPQGVSVPYPALLQRPSQQPCTPPQTPSPCATTPPPRSPPPCGTTPAPTQPPCGTTPAPSPPCQTTPAPRSPPCGTTPAPQPPPCGTTPTPSPPPCGTTPAPKRPPPCGTTPAPTSSPCSPPPSSSPPCGTTPRPSPPPCQTTPPPCATTPAPSPPPCTTPAPRTLCAPPPQPSQPPCAAPAPAPTPTTSPCAPSSPPPPPPSQKPSPPPPPPPSGKPKKGSILLEYDDPVRIHIFSNDKKYLPASGNIYRGQDDGYEEEPHSYFFPTKQNKKNDDVEEEEEEVEEEHVESQEEGDDEEQQKQEEENDNDQLAYYESEDEKSNQNEKKEAEEEEDESETNLSVVRKPVSKEIQKNHQRRLISLKSKNTYEKDDKSGKKDNLMKEEKMLEKTEKMATIKKPKRKKWVRIIKKQRRKSKTDSSPQENYHIYTSDNSPESSENFRNIYYNGPVRNSPVNTQEPSAEDTGTHRQIELKKITVNNKPLSTPDLIREVRRHDSGPRYHHLPENDEIRRKKLEKAVERYVEDYVEKQLGEELLKNTGVPKTTIFEFAPKNGPRIQTITTTVAKTSGNPSAFQSQFTPVRADIGSPVGPRGKNFEESPRRRGGIVNYEDFATRS